MAGAVFVLLVGLALILVAGWPRIAASRRWRWGVLLTIAALAVAHQLLFGTLAEDAFITFRYATNLADGFGPVFNIGEQVEGYTNFLLVVILAGLRTVFDADVVVAARGIGLMCTVGCVFAAYLLARRLLGRAEFGVLAAALTATAGSLAAYGPSGLETSLFALLLLGALLAVCAERWVIAGLLVALATMTRPEGLVVAGVIVVWLGVLAARRSLSWWKPTAFVLGGLVLGMPWTAWRLIFYGHLLPNALAAKSGGDLGWQLEHGWRYFVGYAQALPVTLVLFAGSGIALFVRRGEFSREVRARLALLGMLCLVLMGFTVLVGGDWMPAWRMFAPLAPLLAVFVAGGLACVSTVDVSTWRARAVPAVAAVACALSLLVSVLHQGMLTSVRQWHTQVTALEEIGSWLGDSLPNGTVISTYANGALSYRAGTGLTVVGQLGLTDEHIAREGRRRAAGAPGHIAYDYEYIVLQRRPAVVLTSGTGYTRRQSCGVQKAFKDSYVSATFQVDGTRNWVTLYLRAGEATELTAMLERDSRFQHKPCTTEAG